MTLTATVCTAVYKQGYEAYVSQNIKTPIPQEGSNPYNEYCSDYWDWMKGYQAAYEAEWQEDCYSLSTSA